MSVAVSLEITAHKPRIEEMCKNEQQKVPH
jgi:hypothetical protein